MIRKFPLLTAFLLLASPIQASQSNFLQEIAKSAEQDEAQLPEFKGVEYPDEVYPWFKEISRQGFPKEIQRLFMQTQATTELEPIIRITGNSRTLNDEGGFTLQAVALSKDSKHLASAVDRRVYLLNLKTLETQLVFTGFAIITYLTFTPDDHQLLIIENSAEREHLHYVDRNNQETNDVTVPDRRVESYRIFSETELYHGSVGCLALDFIAGKDILAVDDLKRVYHFDHETKVAITLWDKQEDFDRTQIQICKIKDSCKILTVINESIDQFNVITKRWSKPLGDKNFPYKSGSMCDLNGKWLILGETLIDLESKECRLFFHNPSLRLAKFSPNAQLIFTQSRNLMPSQSLLHRISGALIASGNKGLPMPITSECIFNEKFLIIWDCTDGLVIYPVKAIWKYHAAFHEGRCSLETLLFVKFLDDLYEQSMVLKKTGIEQREVLVKIVASNFAAKNSPIFEITGPKSRIYPLLKRSQLRMVSADIQKIEGFKYKQPVPRNLSSASMEKLRGIWNTLSQNEKDDLFSEYETSL